MFFFFYLFSWRYRSIFLKTQFPNYYIDKTLNPMSVCTHSWLLLQGLCKESTLKGALKTFDSLRIVRPFRSLALPLQSSVTILSSCLVAAASSIAGHVCWHFFSLDEHLSATSLDHRTLWVLIHLLYDWTARHVIHDAITPFVTTAPRAEPTLVWSDLLLCSAAHNKRPHSRKNKTV